MGAHASILGNISIGSRAKIGCGSVVLASIPSGATAVGAPAKVVGRASEAAPGRESDNALMSVDATIPTAAHFAPPSSASSQQQQQQQASYSHLRHARVRSSGGSRSERQRSRASVVHGGGSGGRDGDATSGSESGSGSTSNGERRNKSFSGPLPSNASASSSGGRTSSGFDSGLDSGISSGNASPRPVNELVFGNFQATHAASSAAGQGEGEDATESVLEQRQHSSTPPRAPPPSFRMSSPPAASADGVNGAEQPSNDGNVPSSRVSATVRWNVNVGTNDHGESSIAEVEHDADMHGEGSGQIDYEEEDEEETLHHDSSSNVWASSTTTATDCGPVWASWRSIWRHLDAAQEGFLTAPQFHERLAAHGHSMNEAQVNDGE